MYKIADRLNSASLNIGERNIRLNKFFTIKTRIILIAKYKSNKFQHFSSNILYLLKDCKNIRKWGKSLKFRLLILLHMITKICHVKSDFTKDLLKPSHVFIKENNIIKLNNI